MSIKSSGARYDPGTEVNPLQSGVAVPAKSFIVGKYDDEGRRKVAGAVRLRGRARRAGHHAAPAGGRVGLHAPEGAAPLHGRAHRLRPVRHREPVAGGA